MFTSIYNLFGFRTTPAPTGPPSVAASPSSPRPTPSPARQASRPGEGRTAGHEPTPKPGPPLGSRSPPVRGSTSGPRPPPGQSSSLARPSITPSKQPAIGKLERPPKVVIQDPPKSSVASSPKRSPRKGKGPRYSDPVPALWPIFDWDAEAGDAEAVQLCFGKPRIVDFNGELKAWQNVDFHTIAEREKNALQRMAAGDKTGFNGTLVAWETGMGKTIVTIRTIQSTVGNGPTLILCPNVEIARQWRSEIAKFAPQLTVRFYHSEDSNPEDYKIESHELKRYDVVLSTYNQLLIQHAYMEDARKRGVALVDKECSFFLLLWYRIVGEEAQRLSNPSGKTAVACWALRKRLGLLLTATPLQNYPCDLYALLRFLGRDYPVLARTKRFPEMHSGRYRALGAAPTAPFQLVKEILGDCMIHRRKAAVSIRLPERHDHESRFVVFTPMERRLHDYTDREHHHKSPLAKGSRLRQACVGPKMLLKPLSKEEEELANDLNVADVKKALEEISQVGPLGDPQTQTIARADRLVASKLPESISHLAHLFEDTYIPSAQREVLAILQEINVRSGSSEKTIVYSTFRSPLETLSAQLDILDIGNEIYYGDMTSDERTAALHRLAADARCTVLLMTIQSGGTGLNITACNNVVFLEPWWNPYLEEQAIGRVYRIGQTKPVHVYRVLVADTIQAEKMVPIQDRKRENIDKLLAQLETH